MSFFAIGDELTLQAFKARVRALIDGVVIVDSTDVLRLNESGLPPVFYFPIRDVRRDLLVPTDRTSHCGLKGEANYYAIHLESGRIIRNGAWQYANPKRSVAELADRVAFYEQFIDEFVVGDG